MLLYCFEPPTPLLPHPNYLLVYRSSLSFELIQFIFSVSGRFSIQLGFCGTHMCFKTKKYIFFWTKIIIKRRFKQGDFPPKAHPSPEPVRVSCQLWLASKHPLVLTHSSIFNQGERVEKWRERKIERDRVSWRKRLPHTYGHTVVDCMRVCVVWIGWYLCPTAGSGLMEIDQLCARRLEAVSANRRLMSYQTYVIK